MLRVTSSKISHTFHTVFFPRPAKHDTVSDPLNACTKGNAISVDLEHVPFHVLEGVSEALA